MKTTIEIKKEISETHKQIGKLSLEKEKLIYETKGCANLINFTIYELILRERISSLEWVLRTKERN